MPALYFSRPGFSMTDGIGTLFQEKTANGNFWFESKLSPCLFIILYSGKSNQCFLPPFYPERCLAPTKPEVESLNDKECTKQLKKSKKKYVARIRCKREIFVAEGLSDAQAKYTLTMVALSVISFGMLLLAHFSPGTLLRKCTVPSKRKRRRHSAIGGEEKSFSSWALLSYERQ